LSDLSNNNKILCRNNN